MSPSSRGRVGIESNRASRVDLPDEQLTAARRLVCSRAHDADDATHLLDVLGLLPAPTRRAEES